MIQCKQSVYTYMFLLTSRVYDFENDPIVPKAVEFQNNGTHV